MGWSGLEEPAQTGDAHPHPGTGQGIAVDTVSGVSVVSGASAVTAGTAVAVVDSTLAIAIVVAIAATGTGTGTASGTSATVSGGGARAEHVDGAFVGQLHQHLRMT